MSDAWFCLATYNICTCQSSSLGGSTFNDSDSNDKEDILYFTNFLRLPRMKSFHKNLEIQDNSANQDVERVYWC